MTPEPTTGPAGARQATAREFLAVVFRRKWIILGLLIVTTVTVLAVALSTPVTYQSVGEVLIKRGEQESLLQPSRRLSGWEEELASEVEVIRSVPVTLRAQQLLDEQAAEGQSRLALAAGQVDAQVKGESNVILIGYVDADPSVAQRACDAVVTAYVEHRLKTLNLAYPRQFFENEIAKVTGDLERYMEMRRNFTRGTGAYAIQEQTRSSIAYLTTLRQRQSELEADLQEARSYLTQLEAFAANPALEAPTFGQGANEQVLVDLKLKIVSQETRLAQLRERYRDDSPDVTNALATLDALRGLLAREVDSRVQVARARITALESRQAPVQREMASIGTELGTLPGKEMTLAEIEREINVLQDRYKELVERSDQARITEQTTPTINVMVLKPARPGTPTNQRDYVRLALAPAFALVVGVGLAFFVDGLDPRVRTPGDVENTLHLPVLASLTERRRRRVRITPVPVREAASR